MEFYSSDDIQEMKRNGYEKTTIDKAKIIQLRAEGVLESIKEAFGEIQLEDGVGVLEADGIDDYKSKEELTVLREKDEKLDWTKISIKRLNENPSSLSFFDDQGLKFNLPAYLVAEIKGEFIHDTIYTLTSSSEYNRERFKIFSQLQRQAIAQFLEHALLDAEYLYNSNEIKKALEEFWYA